MPILVKRNPIIDTEALLISAQEWMADALEAYIQGIHRRVVAFAPIGLEHLGKTLLAAKNPVLLAQLDRSQHVSLIVLSGHGSAQDRAKLRTIGLKDVLSRISNLIGDSGVGAGQISGVIDARNGAVHVGETSIDSMETLATVLRLNAWILAALAKSGEHFYGDRIDTVKVLLDQRASDIERRVETAKQAARLHYQRLIGSIADADARGGVIAAAEYAAQPTFDPVRDGVYAEKFTCPVCSSNASIWGRFDVDNEVDMDSDGGGYVSYSYWVVHWMSDNFYCGVCKLTLTTAEELGFVGAVSPQVLTRDQVPFDPAELGAELVNPDI